MCDVKRRSAINAVALRARAHPRVAVVEGVCLAADEIRDIRAWW